MKGNFLHTITLDCSNVLLGESLEENIVALVEILDDGKDYLARWTDTYMKYYLEEEYNILLPSNLDLINYIDSIITMDMYSQAIKSHWVMESIISKREKEV